MVRGADERYRAASQVRGRSAGQYACGPINGGARAGQSETAYCAAAQYPQFSQTRGGAQPWASARRQQPKSNAPRGWSWRATRALARGVSRDCGIRSQSRADYAGNKGSALSSVAAYAVRNRGPRGDEPSSTGLFGLNKAACSSRRRGLVPPPIGALLHGRMVS